MHSIELLLKGRKGVQGQRWFSPNPAYSFEFGGKIRLRAFIVTVNDTIVRLNTMLTNVTMKPK